MFLREETRDRDCYITDDHFRGICGLEDVGRKLWLMQMKKNSDSEIEELQTYWGEERFLRFP